MASLDSAREGAWRKNRLVTRAAKHTDDFANILGKPQLVFKHVHFLIDS